jgi:hypothetical protein
MLRLAVTLGFACVAATGCATAPDELDEDISDGKGDRAGGSRFDEVDPTHSTASFRKYIGKALDALDAHDSELAGRTLWSIEAGYVKIDELRDLTCADFERVRADLPDAGLTPEDRERLHTRGSDVAATIENELDGYMWSNRIYVSRGQSPIRLAATLIHEVNHVLNRSEVGYYDDLPTSAFIHEYRAFYAEAQFDTEYWAGTNIVDYVIREYELDRNKIKPSVLAQPLTPRMIPDSRGWRIRNVTGDREDLPAVCR